MLNTNSVLRRRHLGEREDELPLLPLAGLPFSLPSSSFSPRLLAPFPVPLPRSPIHTDDLKESSPVDSFGATSQPSLMQRKQKCSRPADTLGAPTAKTPDPAPDEPPEKPHLAKRQRLLPTGKGPVSSDGDGRAGNGEGSGDRYECDDHTSDDELRPAEAEGGAVGSEDDECPSDRGDDSSDCGLGNGDGSTSPPSEHADSNARGVLGGSSPSEGPPPVDAEDNQYAVEWLLKRRVRRLSGRNKRQVVVEYLVKWEGYGNEPWRKETS
jgi:hypothetical protein